MKRLEKLLTVLALIGTIPHQHAEAQKPSVESHYIHFQSLDGNLIGDNPVRHVSIYLPAAYEEFPDAYFPVIYLLHGWNEDHAHYMQYQVYKSFFGEIGSKPMIVVIPDGNNVYGGGRWVNSFVSGNWEDAIIEELIPFIDDTYRTLRDPTSRGITGKGMGAGGAFWLAMKHPDIFGAVYGMRFSNAYFEQFLHRPQTRADLLEARSICESGGTSSRWQVKAMIARCTAYAPDSTSGGGNCQCNFPLTTDDVLIDTVWAKWLEYDQYALLPDHSQYRDSLRSLAIAFDMSEEYEWDPIHYPLERAQRFDTLLTELDIEHTFGVYPEPYEPAPDDLKRHMPPFFRDALWAQIITGVVGAEEVDEIPRAFSLSQNYPNPFNPSTTISYDLPRAAEIMLSVYDVLGREVRELSSGTQPAGRYEVSLDATGLPSGIYLYRLQAGDYVNAKSMVVYR